MFGGSVLPAQYCPCSLSYLSYQSIAAILSGNRTTQYLVTTYKLTTLKYNSKQPGQIAYPNELLNDFHFQPVDYLRSASEVEMCGNRFFVPIPSHLNDFISIPIEILKPIPIFSHPATRHLNRNNSAPDCSISYVGALWSAETAQLLKSNYQYSNRYYSAANCSISQTNCYRVWPSHRRYILKRSMSKGQRSES